MQKEVAEGIGMNPATYCRKERDQRGFTVDEIERVIEFLGMNWEDVNDVFFGGRLKCGERQQEGKKIRFKRVGDRYKFIRG